MKSDVYIVKINSSDIEQRRHALKHLLDAVNPFSGYKRDEFIPVKLTIGDASCVYNLSPELIKIIVEDIKRKRAKPFLFDTSVIYKGKRHNAIDHLTLAQAKGFGHAETGAPFIIADGLFGQDGKEYIINSGNITKIKIPSFIGILDNLVVLSHVTGHILSCYAGALKNVAMGMSCRSTKQVQHSSVKPTIKQINCTACGCCIEICPVHAISYQEKIQSRKPDVSDPPINQYAVIDQSLCIGCGECLCACTFDAVNINWKEDSSIFMKRMAEVTNFILPRFKNRFFINFAFDITEECDCISTKNEKMVSPDIGILASSDPLSLDKATADVINVGRTNKFFIERYGLYNEMFEYAAKIGIGSLEYKLIEI